MRRIIRGPQLAMLAIALSISAGCQNSGATPDEPSTVPDTVPDTTVSGDALPEATTTTIVAAEEAAYNVYRTMLDTSLAIGIDLARKPDDGSLDPLMTAEARMRLVLNLEGLKRNGLTLKGAYVTRLLSSEVVGPAANLKVCSRDDVDQFDRTGKQLTPVGQGTPQVEEVQLVRQGSGWLVDKTRETGSQCDV